MSTIRSGKLRRAGASSNGYLRSIYGCSQDGSPTVLVGTNSTVPPWRASRTTLMTRFIMRSAILSGSVGSSGARPAPDSSRAVAGGLVPLRELLQEPGELARQPFRLKEVHP